LSEITVVVAPQYDDAEQQQESSSLGMWLFLATEIMFFGGLFLGYTAYRWSYPVAFAESSRRLDVLLGGINTAILLTSSLTMAMAVHSAQQGKRGRIVGLLLLTILLGFSFLGIKFFEYFQKFEEHLVPGHGFEFNGTDARHAELFFSFYFSMTGVHALHMIIGIGVLSVLIFHVRSGRFSSRYYTPIEMAGLYWHFVDIVWVFLFPLLYLVDRS
jgi:cytochrome c oxidase subunit 3